VDIESSYIGTWNGTLPEGGETQMPNTLEEFAGTVGVTVGELIFAMLREGAIGGAVLAVIAFLLSRFTTEIYGRALLAIFLFAAAGAYFGFAVLAGAGPIWTLVELVGVIVFGVMALLGLRDSAWWLAVGWALHPLWDVVLHYWGPGRSFASQPYAIACITFDWVVAAYIAIVYGFGLLGVASRRRDTAPP
jgi:hypothetical protein